MSQNVRRDAGRKRIEGFEFAEYAIQVSSAERASFELALMVHKQKGRRRV